MTTTTRPRTSDARYALHLFWEAACARTRCPAAWSERIAQGDQLDEGWEDGHAESEDDVNAHNELSVLLFAEEQAEREVGFLARKLGHSHPAYGRLWTVAVAPDARDRGMHQVQPCGSCGQLLFWDLIDDQWRHASTARCCHLYGPNEPLRQTLEIGPYDAICELIASGRDPQAIIGLAAGLPDRYRGIAARVLVAVGYL